MTPSQLASYAWLILQIWLGVSLMITCLKYIPYERLSQGIGSASSVAKRMGQAAPGTQAVESLSKPSDRSTQDIVDEAGVSQAFLF